MNNSPEKFASGYRLVPDADSLQGRAVAGFADAGDRFAAARLAMRTCQRVLALLAGLGTILTLACDEATSPGTGAIQVIVSTTGIDLDPSGYRVSVDNGTEQAIASNAEMMITSLRAGSHLVRLTGLSANCSVGGSNPLTVVVVSGGTVIADFAVSCVARTGSIQVTTATSGQEVDTDGYVVTIDGGAAQAIPTNGTVSITGLTEGRHTVLLSGVATNCTVNITNPQRVDVTFGSTTTVAFTVACVVRTGFIRVTTTTTGADLDPDGYIVNVDAQFYCYYGLTCAPIATNGTVLIGGLSPGNHTVSLEGVANNCTVAGANPRTVSVTVEATVDVAFAIQCAPMGRLRVTVETTGVDFDPNGYRVGVEGTNFGTSANVSAIFSATVVLSLLPGDYRVSISGVAANCNVASPNQVTAAVSAGSETVVAFAVTCVALTQLAFVNRVTGNTDIYTIKSNGTGSTRLTTHAASDVDPAWSPDGSRIAFASDRDGNSEIYVMNADGSNPVRLTNAQAQDYSPAWSPDGARIAFVSERDGNAEIYVMSADGTSPVRLTSHSSFDGDPAWSPDGSKIAFRSDRDGNPEIYVMSANGSGLARLTNSGLAEIQPAWSPDGARIAFSRGGDILVMNSDGSGLILLTSIFTDDTDPTWSPDGSKIAFAAAYCDYYYYGCVSDLQVINADGTGLANLTFVSLAFNPSWRP